MFNKREFQISFLARILLLVPQIIAFFSSYKYDLLLTIQKHRVSNICIV
jgi:hypothetical protein